MSAPRRLVAYGAGLVLIFGLGWGLARTLVPESVVAGSLSFRILGPSGEFVLDARPADTTEKDES